MRVKVGILEEPEVLGRSLSKGCCPSPMKIMQRHARPIIKPRRGTSSIGKDGGSPVSPQAIGAAVTVLLLLLSSSVGIGNTSLEGQSPSLFLLLLLFVACPAS